MSRALGAPSREECGPGFSVGHGSTAQTASLVPHVNQDVTISGNAYENYVLCALTESLMLPSVQSTNALG